jgi:hypothetical protein
VLELYMLDPAEPTRRGAKVSRGNDLRALSLIPLHAFPRFQQML